MQSVQESKQELEAAIRYAENAISSAKTTIESMEFRQEMAKKQYAEQTGREEALTKQVQELEERNDELNIQIVEQTNREATLEREVAELKLQLEGHSTTVATLSDEIQGLEAIIQGQADDEQVLRQRIEGFRNENRSLLDEEREMSSKNVKYLRDEIKRLKREVEVYTQKYSELAQGMGVPTMPVIPKAVAIAIFREGVAHGVEAACAELEGGEVLVEESEYVGGFEVSFSKTIDLDEELDLDWMRDKVGRYDEGFVVDALKNLCADKEFECRIHGVDDQEEKKND